MNSKSNNNTFINSSNSTPISIDTIMSSLESLEIITNSISDMICIRDLDFDLIYISQGVKKILGYSPDELKKIPMNKILTGESNEKANKIFQYELENDTERNPLNRRIIELEMYHKNGSVSWIECTMSFIYDNNSNPVAMIGIDRDITSLKKTMNALHMSETRYRDLVETANDLILITDHNGLILMINNTMSKLMGYSDKEFVSSHYYNFIHPGYRDNIKYKIDQQIRNKKEKQYYEYPLLTKDGKSIWVAQDIKILTESGKINGFRGVAKDITKQKKFETRYKLLADNIPDIIWITDLNFNLSYINPAAMTFTGYTVQESFNLKINEYMSKDSLKKIKNLLKETLKKISNKETEDSVSKKLELEFIHKDGSSRIGEVTVSLIYDDSGKISGLHGITRDITSHKQSEAELIKSEEKYRSILENMNDTYYETDIFGNFTFLNESACKLFEDSMNNLIGMNNREYTTPETARKIYEFFTEIRRTGKSATIADYEVISKNGRKKIIDMTVSLKYDSEGNQTGYSGIARDITDHKRTEEEIIKAKKIESIGILAGGIAHDFNNILTAIVGNISLARLDMDENNNCSKLLYEAEKASLRAKDLTQQLLTFSKGGIPVKKTTIIKNLLVDNTNFNLSGSFIKCQFDIPDDLWNTEVDEGQISQVIQNLVLNARQSMPTGGLIKLECCNTRIDKTSLPPLDPGDYIMISLQDQGTGISEENLPDIFDPYFTTKEEGTGLGLSVAYSIIKNHNGYISVESVLGKGTQFKIYLPATHEKIAKKKAETGTPIFTGGRILLMDDDSMVLNIGEKILKKLKFDVDIVKTGEEAIRFYMKASKNGNPYSAVILDLTIPGGIGGRKVIQILKKFDPEINAIVSSGYSNDMVMANYREYGFSGIIPKPYRFEDFEKTLESVLSRKITRSSPF